MKNSILKIKRPIIFILAFILVSVSFIVNAKMRHHDPAERAKKQTEWMKKELNLSDGQAAKAEIINSSYAEKRFEIMKKFREEMKAVNEAKETELSTVLTKEQMATLKEKKQEFRKNKKQHCNKHK
jgi:Spy/CpxP family protein refolding chaperone